MFKPKQQKTSRLPKAREFLLNLWYKLEPVTSTGAAMLSDLLTHPACREWTACRIKRSEYQRMAYAKRLKWIEAKTTGERFSIRFTAKGFSQALSDKIRVTKADCKEGNCYVVFDIPESERRARDAFRHFLKENGFSQVQKSIWVTRKDIAPLLVAMVHCLGISRWVQIIVGENLTQLKKHEFHFLHDREESEIPL